MNVCELIGHHVSKLLSIGLENQKSLYCNFNFSVSLTISIFFKLGNYRENEKTTYWLGKTSAMLVSDE